MLDDVSALFPRNKARLRDHDLPEKIGNSESVSGNRLIEEELSYDPHQLMVDADILVGQLNTEQLSVFRTIIDTVVNNRPSFFFVSGYGGSRKTFL